LRLVLQLMLLLTLHLMLLLALHLILRLALHLILQLVLHIHRVALTLVTAIAITLQHSSYSYLQIIDSLLQSSHLLPFPLLPPLAFLPFPSFTCFRLVLLPFFSRRPLFPLELFAGDLLLVYLLFQPAYLKSYDQMREMI
jgi:hypothetical protein